MGLGLDLSRVVKAHLIAFGLSLFSFPQSYAQTLEIVHGAHSTKVSLKDMKAKLEIKHVTIDDPVYKTKKQFDGFLLSEVLKLGGIDSNMTADELVYTAKDGYSPNMSFDQLKKHEAVVVFQETGGKAFGLVDQGKAKISPGPFYVVWTEGEKLVHEVPWPYQIVKMEAVRFSEKYNLVYPADVKSDSAEYHGFLLFKNECIRCHSINLQGGDIGPELNAPKNVTEYWRSEVLENFIRNAPSFRYKSKMPAFENLSSKQIDELLSYLRYMARHKIKDPT